MADRITTHHLLFPRALWQRAGPSNDLRSSFVIKLRESAHDALNDWIESGIGYIPPIPPRELAIVYGRTKHNDGPLNHRLSHLIETIREVADASTNSTVKFSMTLTWRNLELQGQYLGILPKNQKE